ncbi:hypothetical protein K470DRAFT_261166 [Piedraia hortae CBS 480.64]|uniref:histidine kinase n=1 Tax=Piedraia hortae CBS 480.64 TaxID=1314780 RepID=A0A6A7BNL3_9PEZI|nr:hypothetical protein K470DRAFT_261166 [Piedraia hortae CBS 480.64]
MRVSIRVQLALVMLFASLVSLAVVSVAVWVSTRNFVLGIQSFRLSRTASLKSAQLSSALNLMHSGVSFVASRLLIQTALQRYNDLGNNTAQNWAMAQTDVADAISGRGSVGEQILLQAMIRPYNLTGPQEGYGVLNVTRPAINGSSILLPSKCPNGAPVFLGDNQCENLGYPPQLYPDSFDLVDDEGAFKSGRVRIGNAFSQPSVLIRGPWQINSTFALLSITTPLVNNSQLDNVLGWLTIVINARLLQDVVHSREGLDSTGQTLLIGPNSINNIFSADVLNQMSASNASDSFDVRYVIPLNATDASRHPIDVLGRANPPFSSTSYPAVKAAFTRWLDIHGTGDDDGALVRSRNENNVTISVGYAITLSDAVDWVVFVEQSLKETWRPMTRLRNVLLACIFGTAGLMAFVSFPVAYLFVSPIRRLREATEQTIEPPGHRSPSLSTSQDNSPMAVIPETEKPTPRLKTVTQWVRRRRANQATPHERRRQFRIPGRVKERRSFITDELSELTATFNVMTDELTMQYERLEERVQQRTAELESSKQAAEAANESKTLFLANISHELKTPLNGILGMCAVCMQENDPIRIKRSLNLIYKSGDLLLNLLTDLLMFSRNQVGQTLQLDEKEFYLRDIRSQLLAIFEKQAKEGQINFQVIFEDPPSDQIPALKLATAPRPQDMTLWGDSHRLMQVLINLVSNAIKFTPPNGNVTLTVRCFPLAVTSDSSQRQSMESVPSSKSLPRNPKAIGITTPTRSQGLPSIRSQALAHSSDSHSPPSGVPLGFEFKVTDSGPGIAEELQEKIFEPFVQGDLKLSKKFGGTGLGLSICSQLANLMRGSIELWSKPDEGSKFTMTIPLRWVQARSGSMNSFPEVSARPPESRASSYGEEKAPAQSEERAPEQGSLTLATTAIRQPQLSPALSITPTEYFGGQTSLENLDTPESSHWSNLHILVAEDNKINQEVILRMLKLEHIGDVTVAMDGQEAIDRVQETLVDENSKQFDLIFMDVQMPNVDGIQSTRKIREMGFQKPIIALSAFADDINVNNCLESGMNSFWFVPQQPLCARH